MYKLRHESWFNPYKIANGKEVNNIFFYRAGEVVAEVGAGWFGNNHIDVAELNDLEFARAIKLNLNRDDHFYINNNSDRHFDKNKVAIYINLDAVDTIEVESLGELQASETDESIYYGEYFNITATFDGERKLVKTMKRTYSRVEKKQKRLNKEAFEAFLKENRDLRGIDSYTAGVLYDNIDTINEFINNLKAA
jgi:hypothetical protein